MTRVDSRPYRTSTTCKTYIWTWFSEQAWVTYYILAVWKSGNINFKGKQIHAERKRLLRIFKCKSSECGIHENCWENNTQLFFFLLLLCLFRPLFLSDTHTHTHFFSLPIYHRGRSKISGVVGQRKCNSLNWFNFLQLKVCHLVGFNLDLDLSGSTWSISTAAQVKNLKIHSRKTQAEVRIRHAGYFKW